MTLVTGTRLGPYEVLSLLGAGGMGDVYRARDTRLSRDVAVKVLPEELFESEERRQRFAREARLLASLNHPNIAVLYSFEEIPGAPPSSPSRHLLVMELLEGETLRARLGAPLSPKKAVEYAVQIANGLAAAHEKGIIHRDVKPENVFLTKDGRAKLLDFGIARQRPPITAVETVTPTLTATSEPGTVVGTFGYMSPEQVLGQPLDARTDLFSLGIVLYEMLTGKRPFQKPTAPETMAAILREDPPELSTTSKPVSPGLERIVRHCLEKEPANRFQSARDVAFALESLSQVRTAGTAPLTTAIRRRRLATVALGVALLTVTISGFFAWGKRAGKAPWPMFKRVTFRRGLVLSARFTPDFQSVVYGAAWEGKREIYVQRLASADARALGASDASVGLGAYVVGTAGADVALLRVDGTLVRLPLEGGTARELYRDISDATWDRNVARLAIVRNANGRQRLEYPVGEVLFETGPGERILALRLSPDGKSLAFYFSPNRTDPSGDVCVTDASRQVKTLSRGWLERGGSLAWSPDGKEIWFTASKAGKNLELNAVTLGGKERLVARLGSRMDLHDIAPDGRVLLALGQGRRELRGRMAGDAVERDLSWLDGTCLPGLAPDGTQMLFQEWGEAGGLESTTYHWRIDSPAPKRLGEGAPTSVSPDWTTALVIVGSGANIVFKLVPIGAGETLTLPRGPIAKYVWGTWHPDGKRVVILGLDAAGQSRLFVQDIAGGPPRPFAQAAHFGGPHGALAFFSPDGRSIAAVPKMGAAWAYCPIDGGEASAIPFLKADDAPLALGDDGRSLFLSVTPVVGGGFPVKILRLDLQTGRRDPWLQLSPPDPAGVTSVFGVSLTPNGRFYSYGYLRRQYDLYVVEGLR